MRLKTVIFVYSPIIYQEQELSHLLQTKLSFLLAPGQTILLSGEMGSGKTTFARTFLREIEVSGIIMSPTYSYVTMHTLESGLQCVHFDLYRLAGEQDFFAHGFDAFFTGNYAYCLVEWPEKAASFFSTVPHAAITIEHVDENSRKLIF